MEDINKLDLVKILEKAHIGVVIHKADTSIVYANPVALELLSLDYDQIIGKDSYDPRWHFVRENGQPLPINQYPVNRVKQQNEKLENEILGLIDGQHDSISWFMVSAFAEGRIEDPNSFIVVTFSDVTETVRPFSAEDIVENAQDIILVTEAENIDYPHGPRIVYVNKAFETLTGYKRSEVLGETPRILQGTLTDDKAKANIRKGLLEKAPVSETLLNYDKSGHPYWIDMNIIPLKNRKGEVTHFAAIERDISQIRFQQEQLEHRNTDLRALKASLERKVKERTESLQRATAKLEKLAYFDPLTNLPNRRLFSMQLEKQVKSSMRRQELIAFGLIDIDDFKQINDIHGHDAGDEVLKMIARQLLSSLRAENAICRYGGEEFAFALSAKSHNEINECCHRLLKSIGNAKVEIADQEICVTASIGVSIVDSLESMTESQAYRKADTCMYEAKEKGKNQVVIG